METAVGSLVGLTSGLILVRGRANQKCSRLECGSPDCAVQGRARRIHSGGKLKAPALIPNK
jgi:hypothetical protein